MVWFRGQYLFFPIFISKFPLISLMKNFCFSLDWTFSEVRALHLCICFNYMTCLFIHSSILYCLTCHNFSIILIPVYVNSPIRFFFKIFFLTILWNFAVYIKFRISLPISTKKQCALVVVDDATQLWLGLN